MSSLGHDVRHYPSPSKSSTTLSPPKEAVPKGRGVEKHVNDSLVPIELLLPPLVLAHEFCKCSARFAKGTKHYHRAEGRRNGGALRHQHPARLPGKQGELATQERALRVIPVVENGSLVPSKVARTSVQSCGWPANRYR